MCGSEEGVEGDPWVLSAGPLDEDPVESRNDSHIYSISIARAFFDMCEVEGCNLFENIESTLLEFIEFI